MVSFPQAIRLGFKNYFKFRGRATRAEFWWVFLVYIPIGQILPNLNPVFWIATLAFIIPVTSLATRRLHDIGKSGWWQVLFYAPAGFLVALNGLIHERVLTSLVSDNALLLTLLKIQLGLLVFGGLAWALGALLGIIFLSKKGNAGPNKYGPDPRQATSQQPYKP
jgi:uncharacterized membrane protein YhaH (DUF805 family)